MNKVKSFRVLAGLTQKEMAKKLGISEGQYREKEKGRFYFNQREMCIFFNTLKSIDFNIKMEDIFL